LEIGSVSRSKGGKKQLDLRKEKKRKAWDDWRRWCHFSPYTVGYTLPTNNQKQDVTALPGGVLSKRDPIPPPAIYGVWWAKFGGGVVVSHQLFWKVIRKEGCHFLTRGLTEPNEDETWLGM
jgi:hypothetical protein